jgi:inosine-uridine nucleoside N-ribohydrolase
MPTGPRKTKVIIDTDIADDIDDAIALAFALGSPELDILGVTVVYGDVEVRAKVARKLCRWWGRRDIPVKMGFERPMGYEWFPGTLPEDPSQREAAAGEPPLDDSARGATEFMAETVRRHPGEVFVLTLGAMTNVAAALCAEPALAGLMAGVVSCAGAVPPVEPHLDWNVAYDVIAAQSIARSDAAWTCIGGDVMGGNSLRRAEFDALEASGLPAAKALLELVVLMKRYKLGQDPAVRTIADVKSASVCDVMVPASFLIPRQMDLRPGRIEVDKVVGCLKIAPDADGPHRFTGRRLSAGLYRGEILRRLLSAPRQV